MAIHRIKHNFTAGEITPLAYGRSDLDRYKNGCEVLRNSYCTTQGPAIRRSGTQFIFDMTDLITPSPIAHPNDVIIRKVPFIYSETLAYDLVFFTNDTGNSYMLVAHEDGVVEDPGNPGNPYLVDLGTDFDVAGFDYAQMGKILHIASHTHQPQTLTYSGAADWVLDDITFTDPPEEWDFADLTTMPSKVSFYEQRLVFGSSEQYPQMLWFSKSGDFYDFGISSPLAESDSLTFLLASGEQNKIQWLQSARSLLIGTLGDEWSVSGGGRPLSYASIVSLRQTNQGSIYHKPIMVGPATVFIERLGRAVDEMVYDYTYDSYDISDISLLASHLIEQYGIAKWAYQKSPNGIIWGARTNGELLGITYQRKHKVVGWHPHDSLHAYFKDIVCIPNGGSREDEVWFVIVRYIGKNFRVYLEKFRPEFKEDTTLNAWFVDCGVSKELSSKITMAQFNDDTIRLIVSTEQTFTVGEQVLINGLKFDSKTLFTRLGYPVEVLEVTPLDADTQQLIVAVEEDGTGPIVVQDYAKVYKSFINLSGIDHLEGEEVHILIDGAVAPPQVVTGGKITLPRASYVVTLGLPYRTAIVPLVSDLPLSSGTTTGRTQRVTNIFVELYRSLGMKIGKSLDDLEVVPFRKPSDLTGRAVPLYDGGVDIPFPEGYDNKTHIAIVQDQPLPLTVISITDTVEVYER